MENIVYINNTLVKVCPSFKNYGADKLGNIYRIDRCKLMTSSIRAYKGYTRRYVRLSIDGIAYTVTAHKVVADAWLGTPPNEMFTDINHKDGDATNNNVSNLEWVTKSQNQRHAVETGLKGKGAELYNATLSEDDVHEICKRLIDGARCCDLAKIYNTSTDVVRKIKAGDTYFHIRNLYVIPHTYKHDFSESTIKWVCEMILKGYSDKGIVENSRNPNLTIIEIKRIRYKIRYKWISDQYF